jgi:predicted exporter
VTRVARLVLWCTFAAALALALPFIRIDTDISRFVTTDMPNDQLSLAAALQKGPAGRLVLIAVQAGDARTAAGVSRRLAQVLRKSELFASVHNGDAGLLAAEAEPLIPFRYQLSDRISEATFSEEQLRAGLEQAQSMLADARGWVVQQLLPLDPTLETLHLAKQWGGGGGLALQFGVWFSKSGGRAIILATTRAAGDDAAAQNVVERSLRDLARGSRQGDPTVNVEFTGLGLLAAEARRETRDQVERLAAISGLLVTLILFVGYRRVLPVLLSLLPVLLGIATGSIATLVVFGDINVLAIAFASILVDEGSDYPSYLFTQARFGELIGTEASRIWPTLRLAILTSVAAFAVLLLAQFRGLQQLGVLCGVGLLVAGVAARWLVPDLLNQRGIVTWSPPRLTRHVAMGERGLLSPRLGALSSGVVIAVALFVITAAEPLWNDGVAAINPLPPDRIAADRTVRGYAGLPLDQSVLVFSGPDEETVLQAQEVWIPTLAKLRKLGVVESYELAALYLPSRRTQSERLAAIPEEAVLRRRLQQAAQGTPFVVEAFEPFFAGVTKARTSILDLGTLPEGLFRQRVEGLLMNVNGRVVGLVPIAGAVSRAELLESAQRVIDGTSVNVEWFEPGTQLTTLLSSVRQRLVTLLLICALAIFAVLLLDLRSMAKCWRVMLPVLTALTLTVAVVRLVLGPLTVFNVVALMLLLGVLTNYSLFIHSAPQSADQRQRLAHTVFSLLVASGTTLAVFGALGLSGIGVVEAVGRTVVVGIIVGLGWIVATRGQMSAGPAVRPEDQS